MHVEKKESLPGGRDGEVLAGLKLRLNRIAEITDAGVDTPTNTPMFVGVPSQTDLVGLEVMSAFLADVCEDVLSDTFEGIP